MGNIKWQLASGGRRFHCALQENTHYF